ncbi:MAG: 4-hydroxy-tetrahydrodipicolinate synthase [Planctomycetes bacterium]|nr:4-hydroxy-tetrahydrodipicolinate synthase [Planctomycetota bacterium]
MFEGSIVALVTPFRNGGIDREALAVLVERQVVGGTTALVACGTTGEAPTLTEHEHAEVIATVVRLARGRVPVIAGTGTYDTAETIRRTQAAAAAGCRGAMIVTPYYNKPTVRGLRAHFLAVADASSIPLIVYNIPGRTGTRIPPTLIAELARHPRIAALKDATGSASDCMDVAELCDLTILAGDDALTLPWMAMGAKGIVSVAGNVVPDEIATLVREAAKGDFTAARRRHYRLLPLWKALFVESNPVPVKAALALQGIGNGEVRLPLVAAEATTIELLKKALAALHGASAGSAG